MTELYGPFDSGAFAEDAWARAARLWVPDCVEANADDELIVVANGGLQSALKYGNAAVHGFFYRNQDAWKGFTHAATTGTAGQSRNDLVVLRLDRTANTITAIVLTGSFAVTPVDPALTQATDLTGNTWDLPIARVNIAANASALGTITMLRPLFKAGLPVMIDVKNVVGGPTTTSGTTELMDTTLGFTTFTVTDARHWYKLRYVCTLASDANGFVSATTRIRDSGSAANPTIASTALGTANIVLNTSTDRVTATCEIRQRFTAGVHTVGASYQKASGTPNLVPSAAVRELSVENAGYAGLQ